MCRHPIIAVLNTTTEIIYVNNRKSNLHNTLILALHSQLVPLFIIINISIVIYLSILKICLHWDIEGTMFYMITIIPQGTLFSRRIIL